MDRCAVLVDAGYLLGAAGTLLTGSVDRDRLAVDYPALVAALAYLADKQTGIPVLRIYWYDAAPDRQPTPAHRRLRVLPDVKVRLGNLAVRDDGRMEQKGVDADLHADLTTLARHRSVADVVLVTGDEDLRRAVEEAQEYGVRVHLWAVEAGAPAFNQSPELIATADRRFVLTRAWISRYIRVSALAEPQPDPVDGIEAVVDDQAEPVTADAGPDRGAARTGAAGRPGQGGAGVAGTAGRPAVRVPSPLDIARMQAALPAPQKVVLRYSADGGGSGWYASGDSPLARLKEITTPAQAWRDNEEDATRVVGGPAEIGRVFGTRWARRARPEQYEALVTERPVIPRHMDGELLRYAEKSGIDTWEDEPAKFEVRHGFWHGIDDVAAAHEVGQEAGHEIAHAAKGTGNGPQA